MAWPHVCIWLRQDVDTSFSIGSVATYHSPSHYIMYCQSKAVMLRRCILTGKIIYSICGNSHIIATELSWLKSRAKDWKPLVET